MGKPEGRKISFLFYLSDLLEWIQHSPSFLTSSHIRLPFSRISPVTSPMTARFTDQRKDNDLLKMRYGDLLHVDRSWLHAAGALTRKLYSSSESIFHDQEGQLRNQ